MSDSQLIIQEELFTQNNTATLFHRARSVKSIPTILRSGWSSQGGSMYGVGVYTTYILNDQFRSYMSRYGNVLVKFKYTGLDNLLCFSPDVAKKIHKDKHLLIDQLKKLVPSYNFTQDDVVTIEAFQKIADTSTYSADAAKRFVDTTLFDDLHSKLSGIEYYGIHDGHCIVIYPPGKGIELIAYVKDAPIEADANNLDWISIGVKKTFRKAFDKGIFVAPDIALPIPSNEDEKLSFMEFVRKMREKNEVTEEDVNQLFKYSFSNKSLLSIFEKLNPDLLLSHAFLTFFIRFGVKQDDAAQLKVLEVGLKHRSFALLEYLYKSYSGFSDSFKKEISKLLFTTNIAHLADQGKNELGKVFSRFILDTSNDVEQLKHQIIDYIIKNNMYQWFNNVAYNDNGTELLFQSIFKTTSDIIEFIKKAKTANFNLNGVIAYIAGWFNKRFSDGYTDDELLTVIEMLKEYPDTGRYFNPDNHGSISYRLANIYLLRHPDKITAQLLPSVLSSVTEQNIDLLDKINPSIFKTAERLDVWTALKGLIVKSKDAAYVQKIWKYAMMTSLNQDDYLEILNDHLSSDSSSSHNTIWEALFKNIVHTFVLNGREVKKLLEKVRYPSNELLEVILNELSNPNQFDEEIFYVLLDKIKVILDNTRLFKWIDGINQKYPSFIRYAISKPEFKSLFLPEGNQWHVTTDIPAYLYLTYAPENIETLTTEQLTILVRNLKNMRGVYRNPLIAPLISKYLESDVILNKSDEVIQELILANAPLLNKDNNDQQQLISVLQKLMSVNPDVINNFGGYYMDKFFENSTDKKGAVDFILKYKNEKINYNDILKLMDLAEVLSYNPSLGVMPKDIISKIFEIKKDKLDEESVNLLITNCLNRSVKFTPTQIIELLKQYNPNYIRDINSFNWIGLLNNSASNPSENEKIENIIFSIPINSKTNHISVKETLIDYSTNKSKTINRILDSGLFTTDDATLEKMLQYPVNKNTIDKIIKIYRFDLMDGKELAELYNRLGGYSRNTDDYTFKNNKNGARILLNEIGKRLNALGLKEQVRFISYASVTNAPFLMSPFQLVAMNIRDISTDLFKRILFSIVKDSDVYYRYQGPSNILKILLKYNNNGWNIENFFNAVSDNTFKQTYSNIFIGESLKLNALFALVLKHEKQNLHARTLKAILDHASEEEKKKIIDIVLTPEFKGSNLDSQDVFVIMSNVNQMYDDAYATKVVLNILRLVNVNITDNMIMNLVSLCPETINNQSGPEYVANRILLYKKDNLSESAIYNLIRLQSNDDSKVRIINKVLALRLNSLTPKDLYHIISNAPVNALRDIVNKLNTVYDKEYITRLLKNRGLDPNTVLTEMRNYKKYYIF